MTDTVNARARVEAFLTEWGRRSGNGNIIHGMGMEDEVLELTVSDLRALLAAAPMADGMDAYTRPDTMREILDRQLADKSRRLNPKAPKVEQEPYAWAIEVDGTDRGLFYEKTEADFDANIEGGVVQPLYTNSAPASDELLSIVKELHDAGNGLFVLKNNRGDYGYFDDLADRIERIAKHKGPQS